MKYQLLGASGLKVSEICLGTMTFGATDTFGEDAATSALAYARYRELGGNFIDTANIYAQGRSEEILAPLIAPERGKIVLASKYTISTDAKEINAGGNSRKNLQQSLELTLRRLKTDYLDLYWVHAWDLHTPLDELLRALDDAVSAGKILYTGFSNAPAWVVARAQTMAELRGWTRFIALQLHYNLVERNIERDLVPCANALGMAVTAWSPLAGGMLSGKYGADNANATAGRLTTSNWGRGIMTPRNFAIVAALQTVAARVGKSPAQVAIRWIMQQGVLPIVGARNVQQLDELLAAADFQLDAATMAELDAASKPETTYPERLLNGYMRNMIFGESLPKFTGFG
jgi:aryl-alcohol dehydrogenase-like predicted oxidoreductase